MILQVERPDGAWAIGFGASRRDGGNLHVVVDEHAIVPHRHAGRRNLFFAIVARSGEVDVVGLPFKWRETHVGAGRCNRIDAATLVVFSLEPEAVEHLHLVGSLDVGAAVAATLSAVLGLVGEPEFDVPLAIAEAVGTGDALLEQAVVRGFAPRKGVGGDPVKQDDRPLRSLLAERGALAMNLREAGLLGAGV